MGASACLQAVCWMQGPPSHRQCLDLPFASKTTARTAVVRTLKHGHSVNCVRRQWHGMANKALAAVCGRPVRITGLCSVAGSSRLKRQISCLVR